ncbi:MAG: B12-binding domain-containing radical SAM protein [Candidatus Omnitrophica bacterium]|nr:B12-binding domain-containing radical SAM protein [Candidatus Omnitrophota bacterium]
MATILMVYCNRLVSGVQYSGIASMSAFAKRGGHKYLLFDAAAYTNEKKAGSYRSYKDNKFLIDLEFRPITNAEVMPFKKPMAELLADLESELLKSKVDVVGFSSFSDDWPFTLFLIRKVRAMLPSTPIIVGGVHATVAPDEVIKHEEVTMLCVGEGEEALVELLDSIDKGQIDTAIQNLWIKTGDAVIKNSLRPLVRLDGSFPKADWTLYNDMHFYYPFEGKLFRRGSVFASRGCPYSCSYCINDLFMRLYAGDKPCRFKGVSYLIDEISRLKDTYALEFLRFWDETFLAMPRTYLSDFEKEYKREIGLPFTIETTATTVTDERSRILAEMGCQSVSVGVETSNEHLRTGLLGKKVSNAAYDECFRLLTKYGLRKVANFMFFLPHQTLDDMWNDVHACKKWKIDHPSARIFYPYPGTTLREYCMRNGMIDTAALGWIEDEEAIKSLNNLSENYITFQDTVMKCDTRLKREGKKILDNFILFQETEVQSHARLVELLDRDDYDAKSVIRTMECDVYRKRFGEEPVLKKSLDAI